MTEVPSNTKQSLPRCSRCNTATSIVMKTIVKSCGYMVGFVINRKHDNLHSFQIEQQLHINNILQLIVSILCNNGTFLMINMSSFRIFRHFITIKVHIWYFTPVTLISGIQNAVRQHKKRTL